MFNSIAVPDPEQFNSADFNREAFIAEARQSNDKLVAQMSSGQHATPYQQQLQQSSQYKRVLASSSNGSPVSNLSTSSNFTSPSTSTDLNSHESTRDEEEFFRQEDAFETAKFQQKSRPKMPVTSKKAKRTQSEAFDTNEPQNAMPQPKYTSFSINSILDESTKTPHVTSSPYAYAQQQPSSFLPNYFFPNTAFNANVLPALSAYNTNQMQLFYSYLSQLNQKQLFLSNLNFNFNSNATNALASNVCGDFKNSS